MPLAWWSKRSLYQKCILIGSLCTVTFMITYFFINHSGKNTIENLSRDITVLSPNSTRARRKASFENSLKENSTSYAEKVLIMGPVVIGTTGTPFNSTVLIYDGGFKIADICCTIGPWQARDPDPELMNLIHTILNDNFKDINVNSYFDFISFAENINHTIRAMIEDDSKDELILFDSKENQPVALPLQNAQKKENLQSRDAGILVKGVYTSDSMFNGTAITHENGYKMTKIDCIIEQMADHIPSSKLTDLIENMKIAISFDYDDEDEGDIKLNSTSSTITEQQFTDTTQDPSLLENNSSLPSITETSSANSTPAIIFIVPPSFKTSHDNSTSLIESTSSPIINPNLTKAIMQIVESFAQEPYNILLPPLEVLENVPFSPIFDQKFKAAIPYVKGSMSVDLTGMDGSLEKEIKFLKMLESSTISDSSTKRVDITSTRSSVTSSVTGKETKSNALSSSTPLSSNTAGTTTENRLQGSTTDDGKENTTNSENMSTEMGCDLGCDKNNDSSCDICGDSAAWKRRIIDDRLTDMNPIFSNLAYDKAFQTVIEKKENNLKQANIVFPKFMDHSEVLRNAQNLKLYKTVPLYKPSRSSNVLNSLRKRKSRSNTVSNLVFTVKPEILNNPIRLRRESKLDCANKEEESDTCDDISDALEEKHDLLASKVITNIKQIVSSTENSGSTLGGSTNDQGSQKPSTDGSSPSPGSTNAGSSSVTKKEKMTSPSNSARPGSTSPAGGATSTSTPSQKSSDQQTPSSSTPKTGKTTSASGSEKPDSSLTSSPSAESSRRNEESSQTIKMDETASKSSEDSICSECITVDSTTSKECSATSSCPTTTEKKDACKCESESNNNCGDDKDACKTKEESKDACKCESESDNKCGDDKDSCKSDDSCDLGDDICNKKRIMKDRLGDVVVPLEKEKPILSKDDARHKRDILRKSFGNLWQVFNNRFELLPNVIKFDINDGIEKLRHIRSPRISEILRRNFRRRSEKVVT